MSHFCNFQRPFQNKFVSNQPSTLIRQTSYICEHTVNILGYTLKLNVDFSALLVILALATPHPQVRLDQEGQAQPQETVGGQAEDLGGHGYPGPSASPRGWRTNSPYAPPAPPSDQPRSQAPGVNTMQSQPQPLAGLRSSPQ